jgi:hypothetical protein
MEDLLLPAYQKLYAALQSLERFSKGQDLFENIACIDSFLSEFRNVSFVLQKSLAHTEYISDYKILRDKFLKNEDCSWLVDKRNQVTKEKPFNLEKSFVLTLYLPNGAGVFPTDPYTIDDEEDYSSIIEMVKRVIEGIPSIEVFFSVEFVYKEIGSERNLFGTIDHGIDAIMALLEELSRTIGGEASKTRELVVEKINELHFHRAPKDFWFIDDYVFYRKDHVFEKGARCEMIMPYNAGSSYKNICELVGVKNEGNYVEETFRAFELMHMASFSMQKNLMTTIMTLKEDGTVALVSYDASIKTTTYRKINEIARQIRNGAPIVAVFHVCEMVLYNDPDAYNQDYSYRSQGEHTDLLSFNMVTKGGAANYCINSEALLDGKEDCLFPTLIKVDTAVSLSFINPLVEAFEYVKARNNN